MRVLQCCVLLVMAARVAIAEDAVTVKLACPNKLGLKQVQEVDNRGAMPGLGVVETDRAHPIGLQPGDILVRINGTRVRNLEEYRDVEEALDPQVPAKVTINRFDEKLGKRKTSTLELTPVDLERLAREAAEKKQREQEIAAQNEQRLAVIRQRVFTLLDGGQVTGARIEEFNKGILVDVAQFLPTLRNEQIDAFNRATDAMKTLATNVQVGDDALLLKNIRKIYTSDRLPRDIAWYLERTPAGSVVVACEDGQAIEYRGVWKKALSLYADSIR